MDGDTESTIEALKKRFKVTTDQGLADRLSLGRSTVTSWRRRGAIPDRYKKMASERPTLLPDFLDPEFNLVEREALTLALVRLVLDFGPKMKDYPSYLRHGPFLSSKLAVGVEHALLQICSCLEEGGVEAPFQAVNLIVFKDYFEKD